MEKQIFMLENKVVRLQDQIYRLQGKSTPTSVNPYDLNQSRIRKR